MSDHARCWICGDPTGAGDHDPRLHLNCIRCPRCGGITIVYDLKGRPFWFRCLGCLHGWLEEPANFVRLFQRPKSELEHFTHYVQLLETTRTEDD